MNRWLIIFLIVAAGHVEAGNGGNSSSEIRGSQTALVQPVFVNGDDLFTSSIWCMVITVADNSWNPDQAQPDWVAGRSQISLAPGGSYWTSGRTGRT